MRRHKFPAANCLLGAFIEPQTDSLDDTDLRSAPVGADQNLQRNLSLQLGFASFVGVSRIGAIGAAGKRDAGMVSRLELTPSARSIARTIAHGSPRTTADRVGIARSCRVRLVLHPRQANLVNWNQDWRRGQIEYRWRRWHADILFGRQRRPDQLNGSERRQFSSGCRNLHPATSAANSGIGPRAAARGKEVGWKPKSLQDFRRATVWTFCGLKRMHGNERQRRDHRRMRQKRNALRAARV